jgi:hypothetical protein
MSELRDAFGDWMTSTVGVKTYLGAGAYGNDLADSVDVADVMVSEKRAMVRNSDGDLEQSTLQILAEPEEAEKFTPNSEVTTASGTYSVIASAVDPLVMGALVVSCA